MFKCLECGHIFEEGEQRVVVEKHGLSRPPYEEWHVCPICGGDYKEFSQGEDLPNCEMCFNKADFDGVNLCENCLKKLITYENALAYMNETNNLVYFIFEYIYKMECPKITTPPFEEEMRMVFLRAQVKDMAFQKTAFFEKIVDFIINDDVGRFVEFLDERGE